ncbi:MAG: inorganic phosphate transporter [Puniceicoccales bacterium]|jgi:PiT family inorganic phosphate transporter|nr:inorganic phosphate transporter [Puniceicoccales bacterium]
MTAVLILAAIGSVFVAFNNGANDVANAFAPAVGAKALKIRHALFIAASLNLVGAVVLGSNVSKTLVDVVVNAQYFTNVNAYLAGMLACMIAAGSFIFASTHTGLPVSSTHAIVGGMVGVAIVTGGIKAINWKFFSIMTLSWILTPFFSAACSLATIKLIRGTIYSGGHDGVNNTMQRACDWIPAFACAILLAVMAAVVHGTGVRGKFLTMRYVLPFLTLIIPAMYTFFRIVTIKLTVKFKGRGDYGIEHVFRRFQAGTSCLIGFAIGSNDVANSVTPVVAVYFAAKLGRIPDSIGTGQIPIWILAMGGLGMSIGVLSLGHKVIGTLGKNITLLTNSRGFSVDFSTAMTIILASVFGLPVSSTHAATGSVIGVGLEKGLHGLNLRLLVKIFATWFLTIPLSAMFTIFAYFILRAIMLPFT